MSCFEKIGNTITNKSKELARKAKTVSETSSLNNIIRTEERKIDTHYKMMGKIYYEKFGNSPDEEFLSSVEAINMSMAKIEETKNEITKIKNRNCCPVCGAHFKIDAIFCSKCGTKVRDEQQDKNEQAYKCRNCGHMLESGALFCDICGAKAENNLNIENEDQSEKKQETAVISVQPVETDTDNENRNPDPVNLPEYKICPSCGAKSDDPEAKFCNECGSSI